MTSYHSTFHILSCILLYPTLYGIEHITSSDHSPLLSTLVFLLSLFTFLQTALHQWCHRSLSLRAAPMWLAVPAALNTLAFLLQFIAVKYIGASLLLFLSLDELFHRALMLLGVLPSWLALSMRTSQTSTSYASYSPASIVSYINNKCNHLLLHTGLNLSQQYWLLLLTLSSLYLLLHCPVIGAVAAIAAALCRMAVKVSTNIISPVPPSCNTAELMLHHNISTQLNMSYFSMAMSVLFLLSDPHQSSHGFLYNFTSITPLLVFASAFSPLFSAGSALYNMAAHGSHASLCLVLLLTHQTMPFHMVLCAASIILCLYGSYADAQLSLAASARDKTTATAQKAQHTAQEIHEVPNDEISAGTSSDQAHDDAQSFHSNYVSLPHDLSPLLTPQPTTTTTTTTALSLAHRDLHHHHHHHTPEQQEHEAIQIHEQHEDFNAVEMQPMITNKYED